MDLLKKRNMPSSAKTRTPDIPTRRLMNVERYKQLLSPDKPLPGNDSNPAPFKTESNLRL
jgi:hypothetical protein